MNILRNIPTTVRSVSGLSVLTHLLALWMFALYLQSVPEIEPQYQTLYVGIATMMALSSFAMMNPRVARALPNMVFFTFAVLGFSYSLSFAPFTEKPGIFGWYAGLSAALWVCKQERFTRKLWLLLACACLYFTLIYLRFELYFHPIFPTLHGLEESSEYAHMFAATKCLVNFLISALMYFTIVSSELFKQQLATSRDDAMNRALLKERQAFNAHIQTTHTTAFDHIDQELETLLRSTEKDSAKDTKTEDAQDAARKEIMSMQRLLRYSSADAEQSIAGAQHSELKELRVLYEALLKHGYTAEVDLAAPEHLVDQHKALIAEFFTVTGNNILTHNQATHCSFSINVSQQYLQLRSLNTIKTKHHAKHHTDSSTGLKFLTKRVEEHNGTLTVHQSKTHFEVVARFSLAEVDVL